MPNNIITFPRVALPRSHATTLPSDTTDRSLPPIIKTDARTSPALCLPTEVLGRIFVEYGLLASPVVYLPPQRNLYPWMLGHVCHQWRVALWNSPDVWSAVQIVEPISRDPQEYEALIWTILSAIIARTTAIISLSIHQSPYSSAGISNLIKSFSPRLHGLTIHSSSHNAMRTLLELKPGSLPNLADLCLFNFGSNVRLSTLRLSTNLPRPDLPRLRTLKIEGNASITPYLYYIPLSQLTRLEITGHMVSSTIIHFVLQQCSSINSATFSICENVAGASEYKTTGIIRSPIKHLTISPRFTLDWSVFLETLFLPSLTTLTVTNCSNSLTGLSPTFSPAMVSLINRSQCPLNSLSVSYHIERLLDAEPPHPNITDLLQKTPDLRAFTSGYVATPDIIRTAHSCLAQLRTVIWRVNPDGLSAILDLLDEHIARKSNSRGFPRSINVVCCNGDGFTYARMRFIKAYARYKEAGVDITVRNVEDDDIRYVGEEDGDKDSDDSDTESVWAAGLGDDVLERSSCCCVQ